MKKLFTFVTLMFFSSLLLGQTPFKDLDVRKYKYADAKNRAFDVSFDQTGENRKNSYGGCTNNSEWHKGFQIQVSFSSHFFKNTRKLQHTSSMNGNLET